MDRLTDRSREIPLPNSDNATFWARVHEELARYEDTGLSPEEIREMMTDWLVWKQAEAERRIIVLPCKVGDTVYFCLKKQGVASTTIKRFQLNKNGLYFATYYGVYHIGSLGKTVFLAREEAEKALERSKNNDKP